MGKFYDQLVDTVETGLDKNQDGNVSFSEAFNFGKNIVVSATTFFDQVRDEQQLEELIVDCQSLWDQYGAPVDLPIPNLIETVVDNSIRRMIDPVVRSLHERYLAKYGWPS